MNDHGIFRGKRKDNGEWVFGYYTLQLDIDTNEFEPFIVSVNGKSATKPFISSARIDPATLGQCTERQDKDGRFIYKGDLVEWDGQSMETYEIVYGDDASFHGVPVNGNLERVAGESLSLLNSEQSVVIVGNVHDVGHAVLDIPWEE